MKHLPLFFDLLGRRVVVVGEGPAADRRAALARSAGAEVRQLPDVQVDYLRGSAAVFIATGDAHVHNAGVVPLRDDALNGPAAAVEFLATSITSGGDGSRIAPGTGTPTCS